MEDFRYIIAKDYYDLVNEWNNNNMLYNSLRFYQIYSGHVEKSEYALLSYTQTNQLTENIQADIMTSWWTPVKWFLFRQQEGNRKLLTKKLIELIPKENNLEQLTKTLLLLRYKDENSLSREVVNEMLEFLRVVYSGGNLTSNLRTKAKGPLDGWDFKLEEMKFEMSNEQWAFYVKDNCFQVFFKDEQYQEVKRFWGYGSKNLKDATDADWMQYFKNARQIIIERSRLLKEKS